MADYGIEFEAPGIRGMIERVGPSLFGAGMRVLLTSAARYWRDDLRREAPRDQGELIASFAFNVQAGVMPTEAHVGSNSPHARPQNYGTGLLSTAPDSSHRRHFPPPQALQGWALRHGFSDGPGRSVWSTAGGKVSRAIGRRGGLRPNEFMKRSRDATRRQIPRLTAQAVREIEAAWSRTR